MFECEALSNFREPIYQCIIQSMPLPMLQGYIEMTTDEKVKFLLAGISKEFFGVVKCVANYIFALYTKRKEM